MAELTKEQIEKATTWWGKQLQSPSYHNGDNGEIGTLCSLLLAIRSRQTQTPTKIDRFKSELKAQLNSCNELVHLGVDYHPCQILHESAEVADIDNSMITFPWKTNMYFEDEKVMVSQGDGAPFVEVI